MISNPEVFNIRKKLPNVLLLGNGILISSAKQNGLENKDWKSHIFDLAENGLSEEEKSLEKVPYSLQATIFAPGEDNARHKKYEQEFQTLELSDNSLLKDLVSLGFDSILTTNYTYEIENCFHEGYGALKDKAPYVKEIERRSAKKDTKYLLHTFNQFKNSPPIWHIHGELRRKSSVILTHDEYSRMIHRLVDENMLNQNKYVCFADEVKYKSWLDYFLMSNLYVVGLGFDFSEFDLWWILNRRTREKAKTGRMVFFYSECEENKSEIPYILSRFKKHVQLKTFAKEQEDKDQCYIDFYKKVTEYIKNDLSASKEFLS